MENNNKEVWQTILGEIELNVSKASFAAWFKNTCVVSNNDGNFIIGVPNAFAKEWLENKFHKHICKVVRNLIPEARNISYIIHKGDDIAAKNVSKKEKQFHKITIPEEQLTFKEFQIDQTTNLNPRYTFENFIVGSFNELAHAAAVAVTNNLGNLYNPLFIYGGVGLGKTHLIQAIGNYVKKANPKLKIQYITSEKFANDFVNSLQSNSITTFKEKYRQYDLLIIDDVQFFSGKFKTQEEFFHTFNSLQEENKQIVLSSDKPPKSIPEIEERLRSRFEGGMITDIIQPEYEERLAILKAKTMTYKDITLPFEILEYLAKSVLNNIRELEGALNMVIAKIKIAGRNISINELKEILKKSNGGIEHRYINAGQIIKAVAEFYDISEKSLFEKTRKKEIVKPRQVAMYLLREIFNGSYPFIGQKFGGRDHTTAIHAYNKISKDIKNDDKLSQELKYIQEKIYSNFKY